MLSQLLLLLLLLIVLSSENFGSSPHLAVVAGINPVNNALTLFAVSPENFFHKSFAVCCRFVWFFPFRVWCTQMSSFAASCVLRAMSCIALKWGSSRGGQKSAVAGDFQLKSGVLVIFNQSFASCHFVVRHFHSSRWKEEESGS